MSKNQWGADPEKYKRLSEPFESEEQATLVSNAFLVAVGKLREQYKIPDLIISFRATLKKDDSVYAFHSSAGWGNQLLQAKLARQSADQEFAHLVRVVDGLVAAYPESEEEFITDPMEAEQENDTK